MKLEDFFKGFYIQTRLIDVDNRKIVVKCYSSSSSFKWYLISPAFRGFPYTSNPLERMNREINFFTYNWGDELKVPKVIDFDEETICMYREFIDGEEISDLEQFEELGRAINLIHKRNFALGDTKLENFLYNKKVYVIDAEQAIQTSNTSYFSWDLLVLAFSMSYKFLKDPQLFYLNYIKILEGYSPNKEIVKELLNFNNLPLLSLIPFTHYNYFKKAVEKFL
ncbi:hypothetical protein [Sulfurisphaera tokodaii]|uniref:Aminoglycoside phosphotransferase domain-containing protein n=2 Tax=Sulfurisphaera tokodaii TaxID=111955 RepID=Q971H2_SULTO|nr:hypothetical protein [Sulfurisphaera tokodaii]BAB66448.1 hypothetical protein STK_13820 [Sulfurisphaera tokodaii str. 7]HII73737.1 hypothetical protein [Sulfurisphaera tokodaii]